MKNRLSCRLSIFFLSIGTIAAKIKLKCYQQNKSDCF